MITTGTRVRCEIECRGGTVTVEGRVTRMHGARFADVVLGLGGAPITLPVTDLEPISADVVPFPVRARGCQDDGGRAA